MANEFDLSTIFGEITKTLVANQQQLNEADKTNHNHGDNMVKTFQTVQKAVKSKRAKSPAQQLEYASERLKKLSKSGSGQIYADGLGRAAKSFEGKSVTPDTIGTLIEAMMGGAPAQPQTQQQSQPSAGNEGLLTTLLGSLIGGQTKQQPPQQPKPQPEQGGDLLTTLLGGLVGGAQETQQPQQRQPEPQQPGGDLLTSLLGGLLSGGQQPPQSQQPQQNQDGGLMETLLGSLLSGGSSSQKREPSPEDLIGSLLGGLSGGSSGQLADKSNGLTADDLLSGALRYYAAKKSGRSDLEAIMSALAKSSTLGGTPERTQSGALVIQTLLKMMGNR